MTPSRIALLVPDLPRRVELEPFLAQMDDNRWYTNFGPLNRRLEKGIRAMFDAPCPMLTTTANGTLALETALSALCLPAGAQVLIPAFTFVATAAAVCRAGFKPVIADIDVSSWVLTPAIARAALQQQRVDCVLPVAALGCPLPPAEWDEFCEETGIPVLIDAAGAFGNQQAGRHVALTFSLHATKAFGIGEGGLVVSHNAAFIERVRQLCNFGIDASSGEAPHIGTNAKMSELHAAVGLASMQRWPERLRLRQAMHRRYQNELLRCPGITLQARPPDGAYTILQLLLPQGTNRNAVTAALGRQNIETRNWYLPLVHHHPAYKSAATCDLSNALALSPRMLGLPFHLALTDADIDRVCSALATALTA